MKKIIGFIVIGLLFVQCGRDTNLKIAKNQLGTIGVNTSIEDLDNLFKNDSVVKLPENSDVVREYDVYDKEGNKLLVIRTKFIRDSIAGIEFIKIYSDKYKTENDISTASTFKDLVDNFSINKIEPSFNSAIVFIDELNATFALDKKDLNIGEFDMGKISQGQIPDMAKIQYITLWFE